MTIIDISVMITFPLSLLLTGSSLPLGKPSEFALDGASLLHRSSTKPH